ncbi:MAG: alpha/beta hydrolase [Burkholderiaceae bacterium]
MSGFGDGRSLEGLGCRHRPSRWLADRPGRNHHQRVRLRDEGVVMTFDRMARPHSVRWGDRGAAVVCIHAGMGSSRQWRALGETLCADYRVIAGDIAGMGRSPPWPEGHGLSVDDDVIHWAPIVDEAGPVFHLVGHSYGGALAIKLALAMPARIRSLVLYEPTLFRLLVAEQPPPVVAEEIIRHRADIAGLIEQGAFALAAERFITYWAGDHAWNMMSDAARQASLDWAPRLKLEWDKLFEDRITPTDLGAIVCPTLVLKGAQSHRSTHALADLIGRRIPAANTVLIDDVGHMGPLQASATVNAIIREFVQGVDSSRA